MIGIAAFVLLAAAPPTATPTPTPGVRVLLRGSSQEQSAPPAGTRSLSDVARRIKLKLPADQPRKLTNESVEKLSAGVELTTGVPAADLSSGDQGPGATAGGDQAHWQQRYQEARGMVAYWEGEVSRLEAETARLESQFYAMDDPAYRDGVVKPAWDKALVDLQAARKSLAESRARPDQVLEEARRAGALPGWFRGLPEPTPPVPAGGGPGPGEGR